MSLSDHTTALLTSLAKAGLTPNGPASDLIPADFVPTTELYVRFDANSVHLGNFFKAGECKSTPSISFAAPKGSREAATYLYMMVDPDAPTPADPKFAFWRHFVVSGLETSDGNGVVGSGRVLTEYLAPGPKEDSGPHRYLFLLFEEPASFQLTKEDVGGEEFVDRRSFKVADFVKKHGLKLVGVNWMICAWDGYQLAE